MTKSIIPAYLSGFATTAGIAFLNIAQTTPGIALEAAFIGFAVTSGLLYLKSSE